MAWSKTGLHFPEKKNDVLRQSTAEELLESSALSLSKSWLLSCSNEAHFWIFRGMVCCMMANLDYSEPSIKMSSWIIKVHASKCLQFGFFQSLIMIITSIAWKGNVGTLVMSSSHRHASSASCSWITAKGTEKMSIERDSAWRVKCYSAMMSLQLICKQANKLKL